MRLEIYSLKTCDTCRKAIKALQGAGQQGKSYALSIKDVRSDGIGPDILENLVSTLGWKALLNTRSTTWRGLSDADKADIDASKAMALITKHPTLMKRPVILSPHHMTVGWSPEVQDIYLSKP